MPSADVGLHVSLLVADKVAGAATQRVHPLLPVHVERHVTHKVGVVIRVEPAYVAAVGEGGGIAEANQEGVKWRSLGGKSAAHLVEYFPQKVRIPTGATPSVAMTMVAPGSGDT